MNILKKARLFFYNQTHTKTIACFSCGTKQNIAYGWNYQRCEKCKDYLFDLR